MTAAPPDRSNASPLGAFAGLVGTLASFLFFTGWIYRWAYFGFFEIELNSLQFPAESFLLVPMQVLLGDAGKLVSAILVTLILVVLIKATLWLIEPLSLATYRAATRLTFARALVKLHCCPIFRGLRWFTNIFPRTLRRDLTIVSWILIGLFWLAQSQGTEDAWRDAVNHSSTRPIVTLVSPSDQFALGAILDDEMVADDTKNSTYLPLENLKIFGDVEQFRALYGKGINDLDASPKIIWRLLIEDGNWLYIFPALPERQPSQRPLILAVHTGDGPIQSIILSRPQMTRSVSP